MFFQHHPLHIHLHCVLKILFFIDVFGQHGRITWYHVRIYQGDCFYLKSKCSLYVYDFFSQDSKWLYSSKYLSFKPMQNSKFVVFLEADHEGQVDCLCIFLKWILCIHVYNWRGQLTCELNSPSCWLHSTTWEFNLPLKLNPTLNFTSNLHILSQACLYKWHWYSLFDSNQHVFGCG